MKLLQAITDQGAISADWVTNGAFIVIGFLLVLIAKMVGNSIVSSLKSIDNRVGALEKNDVIQDTDIKNLQRDKEIFADAIYKKWGLTK